MKNIDPIWPVLLTLFTHFCFRSCSRLFITVSTKAVTTITYSKSLNFTLNMNLTNSLQ